MELTNKLDVHASLTEIRPFLLEFVHINVQTHEIRNEEVSVQELSTPGSGDHVYDRVLEHLSTFHLLRCLILTGPLTITPTLFRDLECNNSRAIFPVLEMFALEFTPSHRGWTMVLPTR